ncbi:MAG: extracellular solute-binding protein [Verrucomicrobia bacterium]|nr:extracellular solute-binding protein [Verrucomicrobiota bacterium]MCH8527813.1 extracellular solute-binding protein [Kiritimatiellia bacterium]
MRRICVLFLLSVWGGFQAPGGVLTSENGAPVVTVVVHNWVLPDATRNDPMSRANLAVVRAFQQRYPEIVRERYAARYRADPDRYGDHDWDRVSVRTRKFTGIRVEGVESDLMAIAGGVAPDVMYLNFRRSDTYIRQGFLAPLDDYLAEMPEAELAERVHEKVWPVIRRPGPDGTEHTWALPYGGLLGKGLLYRKDRFAEAGLAPPDASWTWEDLHHAVRVLSDPGTGRYGIRFARGTHESYQFTSFLWSAGAEFMVRNPETNEWTIEYDSREAAVALDFYTRLVTEPWVDAGGVRRRGFAFRDTAGAWAKWQQGDIAITQGYVDEEMFDVINPELTGLAPIPKGPDGFRASEVNSRMLGLFRDIRHPVVRDAAWEFIRFFDSEEAQEIRTRILVESGLAGFLNPRQLERFGYGALLKLTPPGWMDVFALSIQNGRPEPYGPNSNIAYDLLSVPLQRAQELALAGELPEDDEARLDVLQGLLREAAERARRDMLGITPPEELRKRNTVSALVLIVLAAGYAWVIRRIVKTYARAAVAAGEVGKRRNHLWVAALMFPALATVALWQYVPLGRGSLMAFQDYRLLDPSPWVGLRNFGEVLFDSRWWQAVWTAIRYTLLVMGLTFLPPMLLAVLLQEVPRARLFFRTVYYLPAVVNGLVMILMWKSFYEESERGLLNAVVMRIPAGAHVLGGAFFAAVCVGLSRRLARQDNRLWSGLLLAAAGGFGWTAWTLIEPIVAQNGGFALGATLREPVRWLSDPATAMLACVLPLAWAGMGPGCLVYLAALKGIDEESYEAAEIDGAGFLDKILFVVAPRLKPLILINFIGVFIAAFFHAEVNILAMTGGGANTEVAGLHIFYQAFIYLRFGPATAMAWLLGALLIGFTLWQLRMLANLEFRTSEKH